MSRAEGRSAFGAIVLGLVAAVGVVWVGLDVLESVSAAGEQTKEYAQFDEQGKLKQPLDYRQWVFVGAPVTPNDMNDGHAAFPEFHDVYIDPASYAHYKQTGEWMEGTVMVKELVSVGAKQAPSGNGYFPGDFEGLAASVHSAKRFPDEPGNWAYFNFSPKPNEPLLSAAPAEPTASCNACHQASAADHWVFTQYYPVLRAAKPKAGQHETMGP
jgi:hypothetical protein